MAKIKNVRSILKKSLSNFDDVVAMSPDDSIDILYTKIERLSVKHKDMVLDAIQSNARIIANLKELQNDFIEKRESLLSRLNAASSAETKDRPYSDILEGERNYYSQIRNYTAELKREREKLLLTYAEHGAILESLLESIRELLRIDLLKKMRKEAADVLEIPYSHMQKHSSIPKGLRKTIGIALLITSPIAPIFIMEFLGISGSSSYSTPVFLGLIVVIIAIAVWQITLADTTPAEAKMKQRNLAKPIHKGNYEKLDSYISEVQFDSESQLDTLFWNSIVPQNYADIPIRKISELEEEFSALYNIVEKNMRTLPASLESILNKYEKQLALL